MQDILGRPPPPAPPRASVESSSLPFSRIETERGALLLSRRNLGRARRLGAVELAAARLIEPRLLALLALDSGLSDVLPAGALYFDCETTGLGGAGTLAFLVGLARFEEEELIVEQLIVPTPADEPALLELIEQRVRSCSMLVSFNGKTFDWPLLENRRVMNRLTPLGSRPHLDLLQIARRLHRARLGGCRLKTLEQEVLCFDRGPDIDGAQVASRYGHFLRTGQDEALREVVDHNLQDVVTMVALVALYGEPLEGLHAQDLVGYGRTALRAGEREEAELLADEAVRRGGGVDALRLRAQLAKARGERDRALADFEALASELDDPKARLELAKLYEHHLREPGRALQMVELGTSEKAAQALRREQRLRKKLAPRP